MSGDATLGQKGDKWRVDWESEVNLAVLSTHEVFHLNLTATVLISGVKMQDFHDLF